MEPYNETEKGPYPHPMTSDPAIWGSDYKSFLYPIFAIYFEKQKRFGIYRVRVVESYHIIESYKTERTEPFYFHSMGNPSDHPLEVYKVTAQFPFCIWFHQAWLCKKNGGGMSPIFPVMRLTNTPINYKYNKKFSTTVYESPAALEWVQRFKTTDKSVNRLATNIALSIPYSPVPNVIIYSIPTFVKNLLIEDAISKKQDCSITLEPITKENAKVTSCYHVFSKDAIENWLISHTICPICKQICSV